MDHSKAPQPDLSIIIVNWNTQELLDRCLQSIDQSIDELAYEVIVVDNASTDGSLALLRDRFSEIIIIENDTNVGFAKANNQGIRTARGCLPRARKTCCRR